MLFSYKNEKIKIKHKKHYKINEQEKKIERRMNEKERIE